MPLSRAPPPHGALTLRRDGEPATPEPAHGARLEAAFGRGAGHGLLALGADEGGAAPPPVLSYWRVLASRYVTALCALPGIAEARTKPAVALPTEEELSRMAAAGPPLNRAETMSAS